MHTSTVGEKVKGHTISAYRDDEFRHLRVDWLTQLQHLFEQ